jgi:RNA polymerase sigma-70 factor (ECF subfamily)
LHKPYLDRLSCVIQNRGISAQEKTLVDDRELLRRARSLDEPTLGAIFDIYYQPLYRHIYYHVRHRETAEDLTAEVFTRMLAQLAKGQGPQKHLRAWLYRVALNLIVDDSRRRVHRNHEPLDEGVASSEQDVEAQVQTSILAREAWNAHDELTIKQRVVIVSRYLDGQENIEIARTLKMSVGAVKALQRRGLAAIRRYLERTGVIQEGST